MSKILKVIQGLVGFIIVLPFLIVLSVRYLSVRKAISVIGGWSMKLQRYADKRK